MKIIYDFRGTKPPVTGVGHYVLMLYENLIKLDRNNSYIKFDAKDDFFSRYKTLTNLSPVDNLVEGDIYFSASLRYFPVRNKPKVTVVHAITPKMFYKYFSIKEKLWNALQKRENDIKESTFIIASSVHTKKDIIKNYHIPENKIKVVYLGVDEIYKPIKISEKELIRKKLKLPQNFILYLGNVHPRKNITGLLETFALYKKKFRTNYKLVIAGPIDKSYKNKLDKIIFDCNILNDVIFTGYIKEEDKVYYYNLADLFLFLPHYEGFGLPPLEAMACGCPVVTSDNSSLTEIIGNNGILIDIKNIDEIAEKINLVLTNKTSRNKLTTNGLTKSKKFSWQKCAKETLKVLEEAMELYELK